MATLEESITQIFTLYTDPTIKNAEIVKSHALEILISYSDSTDMTKTLLANPPYIAAIVSSIPDLKLVRKALVLTINLSADKEVAEALVAKNAVDTLFELIFSSMKLIKEEHLSITANFYKKEIGEDGKTKTLTVSQDKVSKTDLPLFLIVERIKHAVLILTNISKHSSEGRSKILQMGTSIELCNFLIVLDWLLNPKLKPLFTDFIDVVVNLSADESFRSILIEKGIEKVFKLFNLGVLLGDVDFLLSVYGSLRNFSYETENQKIFEQLKNGLFIKQNGVVLKQSSVDKNVMKEFAILFVDFFLALLTSEKFMDGEVINKDIIFTKEFAGMVEIVEGMTLDEDEKGRVEALKHIVESNKKPELAEID